MHRLNRIASLSRAQTLGIKDSELNSSNASVQNEATAYHLQLPADESQMRDSQDPMSDSEDSLVLESLESVSHRSNARITLSQLFTLYKEYEESTRIKAANPNRYNNGASLRSISAKIRIAKSTIGFYFAKFRTNPDYINAKFFTYKNLILQNARKGIPKWYPAHLEEEVVEWVLANRQEGLTLTGPDIIAKAKEVIKCPKVQFSRNWLLSFLKRNNLSYRKVTHSDKPQEFPQNIQNNISRFHHILEVFRLKFAYDDALVLNMDETPVFFDYQTVTIEEKGKQFVSKLQLGDEKRRVTCVLTATANGAILRPMIIYNQKEILNLESEDFHSNPLFCWSKNGWMDADLMIIWFKKILLPYVKKRRTLLILDRFRAHISKKFEDELLSHDNIDFVLIPPGLTYLLQPLDVSVNKSFKVKVRNEWIEWLSLSRLKILALKQDQRSKNQAEQPDQNNEEMEIVDSSKKEEESKCPRSETNEIKAIEDYIKGPNAFSKEKIKNNKLRKLYKTDLFVESRKKRKRVKDIQIPKVSPSIVVGWIDEALVRLKREKVEMIKKAFRVTGICPLLEGETLHDYSYVETRIRRVVVKKTNTL